MTIWFDMDGTLADLYAVEGWLDYIHSEDTTPYEQARPLINLSRLARYIHKLQAAGHEVGVITWGPKSCSEKYFNMVGCAKFYWLIRHLPSVTFDHVYIESYGTNKLARCGGGILFDDEEDNRRTWGNGSYSPEDIFSVLQRIS